MVIVKTHKKVTWLMQPKLYIKINPSKKVFHFGNNFSFVEVIIPLANNS